MDVGTFCAQSHVLIVAGKGGVGKTTMAAALARMASPGRTLRADRRAGGQVRHHRGLRAWTRTWATTRWSCSRRRRPDQGAVRARRITPDDALVEYLEDHGLRRVSKRLVSSGVVDVVATAIPGIRDVLVLGKVKQLERERVADLIVVDAPATGHAITFLTSASGLVSAARGGPLRSQASDVVELLADPSRCRVILVTLPEEMPVSETIESAFTLEDKAGVQLGPVIVNATDPARWVSSASARRRPAGLDDRPGPPRRARGGPALPPGAPRHLGRADRPAGPRPAPAPAPRPHAGRRDHRPGRDRHAGAAPWPRPSPTLVPEVPAT